MSNIKKYPEKSHGTNYKILILKHQMATGIRNKKKDAVEIKNNILK